MSVLMDPKIDFAFKLIFASNNLESNTILISLLNSILNRNESDQITEIVHLNPFTDKKYDESKQSIMDVKVRTNKDEIIDIEIQLKNEKHFRKRSLYYWSRLYSENIEKGLAYYELKPCIVINILDFNLIKETKEYHSVFKVIEETKEIILTEDFQIHYIELNKLKAHLENKNLSTLEEWIIFIRDGGKDMNRKLVDDVINKSEVIHMADAILHELSADELKKAEYDAKEKWRRDELSTKKYMKMKADLALKNAIEETTEQVTEQVTKDVTSKTKQEIAIKMKKSGATIDFISEIIEMTVEETKKLLVSYDNL